MLKGVFPKSIAYLGIATFVACIVGMALWPVVGLATFGGGFRPGLVHCRRLETLPIGSVVGESVALDQGEVMDGSRSYRVEPLGGNRYIDRCGVLFSAVDESLEKEAT